MNRDKLHAALWRSGISRVWVIVLAVVLVVLAVAGTWVVNTFFWFGTHPPRVDYGQELRERAAREAASGEEAYATWEALLRAGEIYGRIEVEVLGPAPKGMSASGSRVDFDALRGAEAEDTDKENARRILEMLESSGIVPLLDTVAAAPRVARPAAYEERNVPIRHFARFVGIRLDRAWDAGDDGEAVRSVRHGLALAALAGHQPGVLQRLIGIAVETYILERIRAGLLSRPLSASSLELLLGLTDERVLPPITYSLETERLLILEELSGTLPDSRFRPMSRGAQMELLNGYFDLAVEYASKPAAERDPELRAQLDEFGQSLKTFQSAAALLSPAVTKFIESNDQGLALFNGTRLMLAIELHIARQGRPPASLAELVPSVLPEVPADPFDAGGFRYRVDPQSPRGYTLYSVGLDGRDDNGTPSPKLDIDAFMARGAGTDYVFVGAGK